MHQNTAKPGIFGSVKYPLFKASRNKPQFWVYIDKDDFERVNRLMWRLGLFHRTAHHRLDMVEHTTYPRKLRQDKYGLGPLRGTAD